MDNKNKKEVKMEEKTCKEANNRRIEDGFLNVVKELDSLDSLLQEIETGSKNEDGIEKLITEARSISELIKETPKILGDIAEKIRNQSSKLRDLIL